jgi:hypothetical protein
MSFSENLKILFNMKKVHAIRRYHKTGKNVTHFITFCGLIRHMFTNIETSTIPDNVTCKKCNKMNTEFLNETKTEKQKTCQSLEPCNDNIIYGIYKCEKCYYYK